MSKKSIIITISIVLIVLFSVLLINHNNNKKQQIEEQIKISSIYNSIYIVTSVYHRNDSYYMHIENPSTSSTPFDIELKNTEEFNDLRLKDLNDSLYKARLSVKYDDMGTISKEDDKLISYNFLDNRTYKQKGILRSSTLDKNNGKYINKVEIEGYAVPFEFYSRDKLKLNQPVSFEIDNSSSAFVDVELN